MDFYWQVKEKKKFREWMQKLYNAKDTHQFIKNHLGDHSLALRNSRKILRKMKYSIYDQNHFIDLIDDPEAQPLLL